MAQAPPNWDQRYADKDTPWDTGQPSRELDRVLAEHWLPAGRTLEIGCGTGTNSIHLAQRGFSVSAFDLSPKAIAQAQEKARAAKLGVNFCVGDALHPPDMGGPFPFVFDRGVYHVLRQVDLAGFLKTLEKYTAPGGYYLTLAGNANEANPPGGGPPRVSAGDLCRELEPLFELVQLREFRFDGVCINGRPSLPLGWSALCRRRS